MFLNCFSYCNVDIATQSCVSHLWPGTEECSLSIMSSCIWKWGIALFSEGVMLPLMLHVQQFEKVCFGGST